MLTGLIVTLVVLNSLILVALVVGAVFVFQRVSKTADAADQALGTIAEKLPGVLDATEDALHSIELVATRAEMELDRVDSVLRSTDRLISGAAVAEVAVKTVQSGKLTIGRVLMGTIEVLRALKSPSGTTEERKWQKPPSTKEGSENV